MLKKILIVSLSLLVLFSNGSGQFLTALNQNKGSSQPLTGLIQSGPANNTGILEKMIVDKGNVAMDLNLARINGTDSGAKESRLSQLRFNVENDSFFTVLVFNDELRGPLPGTMGLNPLNSVALPRKLEGSIKNLVLESTSWGELFELVVRDGKTGFVYFNIEGHSYDYEPTGQILSIPGGRLLLSKEFATELGRPADAGAIVGQLSVSAKMRAVEVTQIVNDEVRGDVLPSSPSAGTVPGPDVIVGDLNGLTQPDAASGGQVGISVGTDSCNLGTVDLDWFQTPNNDHPVIPQNFYRMSGGATNDERFEQIGQSNVKHAFTALTENICSLGCNGVGGTHLGSGCSDPYVASLNSGGTAHNLGSRAWINPFTGVFPRADSATPPNSHTGHTHTGPAHRILVDVNDLNTAMNAGATYYAEAQYITPHEYVWCQSHPGQCNMYNNVSYRKYNVSGTTSPFSFSPAASTVRTKAAVSAWTGAVSVQIQPDLANDGIGTVAYKVTNPSPGVWHYEYAVYNQNLDRGIQSFGVPTGAGVTLSNIGFHAPPQQPGWAGDGTVGNTGFSSTTWTQNQTAMSMTWSSETFAQNQNANAIRWGTMYNFRFDSNRPPQTTNATIGFYKTGDPITVAVQGPTPSAATNVSVGGRVTTSTGLGVSYARVSITDSGGITRTVLTSPFGYYRFENVVAGGTYTIGVSAKRYTFTPQMVPINDNISNMDFVAEP